MKKIISLLMMLTMILAAFTGCSKPADEKKPGGSTVPPESGEFVYERVCIIGCDGAGTFFQQAETPNFDRIFENGAVTYECLAMNPTISAQCWGSMIHGVLPEVHKLDNTNTARQAYSILSDYPSFFRVVRENDLTCRLASFCKWGNINIGIVEEGMRVYKYIDADDVIAQKACEYLEKGAPKVMLIVFNDPDTGGHTYGYGSQGQMDMIKVTDERIGMVYDAYERNGLLDTTLFIVTADHGGAIGTTGHGGLSDAERKVVFAALGKTVPKGTVGEMDLRDVASIVLYALGYEQPETWTARVPSGLFEGVEAGERPVYEAEK